MKGPNPFDTLQTHVFNAVTTAFGYTGVWNGLEAKVLFREPTKQEKFTKAMYEPNTYICEYNLGSWEGLYDLARDNNGIIITINDVDFVVRQATRIADGNTYQLTLEKDV